ncbi:ASCH domain-containing protein [Flavobacterium sp. XS2P12]|uniref:ASCH domain-containing protein n=1 Tax=Flavobacterium melibiosi TaxID=3398734 RepID=UPI003A880EA7
MKILKLTLKKQYFDQILSGEKSEEYRDVKPYFVSRLTLVPVSEFKYWANESIADYFTKETDHFRYDYDAVEFTNGYSKNSRKVTKKIKYISVAKGNEEWGAEKDKLYFRIHLGEEINRKNC